MKKGRKPIDYEIDVKTVLVDMVEAAQPHLTKGGAKASSFASHEFAQYIKDIQHVDEMVEKGQLTPTEAQFLVDQYKLSMQAVLLTVEGLGVIAVQGAINAALTVLNNALSAALGATFKSLKFAI